MLLLRIYSFLFIETNTDWFSFCFRVHSYRRSQVPTLGLRFRCGDTSSRFKKSADWKPLTQSTTQFCHRAKIVSSRAIIPFAANVLELHSRSFNARRIIIAVMLLTTAFPLPSWKLHVNRLQCQNSKCVRKKQSRLNRLSQLSLPIALRTSMTTCTCRSSLALYIIQNYTQVL